MQCTVCWQSSESKCFFHWEVSINSPSPCMCTWTLKLILNTNIPVSLCIYYNYNMATKDTFMGSHLKLCLELFKAWLADTELNQGDVHALLTIPLFTLTSSTAANMRLKTILVFKTAILQNLHKNLPHVIFLFIFSGKRKQSRPGFEINSWLLSGRSEAKTC